MSVRVCGRPSVRVCGRPYVRVCGRPSVRVLTHSDFLYLFLFRFFGVWHIGVFMPSCLMHVCLDAFMSSCHCVFTSYVVNLFMSLCIPSLCLLMSLSLSVILSLCLLSSFLCVSALIYSFFPYFCSALSRVWLTGVHYSARSHSFPPSSSRSFGFSSTKNWHVWRYVCTYMHMQVYRYADMQACKLAGPVCRCRGIYEYRYVCVGV